MKKLWWILRAARHLHSQLKEPFYRWVFCFETASVLYANYEESGDLEDSPEDAVNTELSYWAE